MEEILKPSKFNYWFSDGDYLYLYNSYEGSNSIRKVERHNSADVERLLQTEQIESTVSGARTLRELGYLVAYDEDEQNKLETAYLEYISSPVLHLYILVTEECNFRCLYCYQKHRNIVMEKDVQDGIIRYVRKNIRRYTGLQISWFGGEPLLCRDVIKRLSEEFIQICREQHRSYRADITTNGYLLTASVMKELINYKIISYQITIDGLQDAHDKRKRLKDGSGTFDVIINNLMEIKRTIHTKTVTFLIRSNFLKSDLQSLKCCIMKYYQYFGDDSRFLFAPGGAGDWGGGNDQGVRLDYFDKDDFQSLFTTLLDCQPLNYGFFHNFQHDGRNICYASKMHSYAIGADGKIYKCTCNFEFKENLLGHVSTDGDFIIDKCKQMPFVVGALRHLNEACSDCFFSIRCAGSYCIVNSQIKRKAGFRCFPPYTKSYMKEQILLLDKLRPIKILTGN